MSDAPDRIWLSATVDQSDDGDERVWLESPIDDEDIPYTRSDLCNRDAIRAEAFEEAAKILDVCAMMLDESEPANAVRGLKMIAAVIRAKAEGGNRT